MNVKEYCYKITDDRLIAILHRGSVRAIMYFNAHIASLERPVVPCQLQNLIVKDVVPGVYPLREPGGKTVLVDCTYIYAEEES